MERQYNTGKPIRIIILKGRQMGLSTATEALLFVWCFLFPGTNALVLSKDREGCETIFEMAKLMWDTWDFRALFTTTRKSTRRLSWAETLSNFRVATAKGEHVGRGSTIQCVHGSEVAMWENAEELMPPLNEAVPMAPGTIIVLERTAHGVGGFFYDTWMAAERGESDYVPMFFAWWKHPEYQIKRHNLTKQMLNQRERTMMEHYDLTLNQLAWRRRKIRTNNWTEEKFDEEYPVSPDVAFLSTGRNVFPLEALSECYYPPGKIVADGTKIGRTVGRLVNNNGRLELFPDRTGELTVYKTPNPRSQDRVRGGGGPGPEHRRGPVLHPGHPARQPRTGGGVARLGHPRRLRPADRQPGRLVQRRLDQLRDGRAAGLGVIGVLQHLGVSKLWRWRMPDRPCTSGATSTAGRPTPSQSPGRWGS